jgi:hypothetical protein
MKLTCLLSFCVLSLVLFSSNLRAQTPRTMKPRDCAVMVNATSKFNPPSITLTWKKNDIDLSYDIKKKLIDKQSWGTTIAVINPPNTSYTDYNVELGKAYEYMITSTEYAKVTLNTGKGDTTYPTTVYGYGYLYAGVGYVPPAYKGKIILLIDSTIKAALPDEIATLEDDMVSEGWGIVEKLVSRNETFSPLDVEMNKQLITDEYNKDPKNVNTVLLLGRVAVPYSGDINKKVQNGIANVTDAHPNHCGAWPADVFYGHMNIDDWTDLYATDTIGYRKDNWNIPGDGKYDVTRLTSDASLAVGRVDFYNMPAFSKSEVELIRNYLKRDHEYRTGQIPIIYRGLVDDNFGWLGGENPGQNAYRNFPPLIGLDSVKPADWFTELPKSSYYWAYGCGGGSFSTCSGIKTDDSGHSVNGTTADFAQNPMNVIFTMLFGSYFGDWDAQNDIMRAILCSDPPALTACWAARPSWYFHHMALGVPIGFSHLISQNNWYDPSGRDYLYTANKYVIQQDPWKGYYYTNQAAAGFVHMALMGDPTLTMNMGAVKPPKNLSIFQSGYNIEILWEAPDQTVDGYDVFYSKNKNGPFTKINTSLITALNYSDPHLTEGQSYYMVKAVKLLSAGDDGQYKTFSGSYYNSSQGVIKNVITTGVSENNVINFEVQCSPNPATNFVNIALTIPDAGHTSIELYDVEGNKINKIISTDLYSGTHQFVWNLMNNRGQRVPSGVYFIKASSIQKIIIEKIVVMP